MFDIRRRTRLAALLLTGVVAIVTAACGDDPVEPPDPAEEVAAVRLTIGTQTVTVNEGGTVTGGPINLTAGGSSAVTATWIRSDETTVTGLEADFELRIIPTNTGIVTFTSTATFAGTLNGVAAGTTTVQVQLFHLEEQHGDFDQLVPVTVQ
jgi:hypothetical protein